MNTQTHDEALVLAASKGDLEAFNQLVLSYQDLASATCSPTARRRRDCATASTLPR